MRKHHPENERVKRRYFAYLEEAKRMASPSVDQAAAAISQFEAVTGYRTFRRFHIEQARLFRRKLDEMVNEANGKPLSRATVCARLKHLRAFFIWLAGQPGYRSVIAYSDAEYFNPSANDARIAGASNERPVPTIEQIKHAIAHIAAGTPHGRRDRALMAFALLSGARDDALASLSLKHVDLDRRTVFQDARSVRTKNRKTIISWFFPVGADLEAIVSDWICYLRSTLLFGPDDPLFPATRVALDAEGQFGATGLDRRHWASADPIRRIFRGSFERAGLPYFNPHSFRKTLAQLGERRCRTPEEFKAWSQNLGHDHVLTTFTSYGTVASQRQGELLAGLTSDEADRVTSESSVRQALETLRRAVELPNVQPLVERRW